ncbi:Eco57I restriction-modification methylase domain-containing protein [Paracnuella aquatica]|uniref:Eco57I restriction-modification methylase domain-containing protein n=1 Tax=Paracnuella aquatica TaxID=2268757 RepID=UPI000DF00558|nr:TaqI-like C-terminal specificity domain-containing protein [Paracnuella aquatica]RPD43565.1 restriction endonuclease subunit M [Paracnuella aquatica]
MAIFQQSVLKKYIGELDKEQVSAAWNLFQAHFHQPATQANIRQAKEEQYQEGFLRDLFVQVLGYTLNPQPGFNLTTEHKNEKDSKKADGAILKGGAVRAVIELKGTDTTDLSKIEAQAFGYLHNQKGCTYVVTSNFEKLRLYIQDATDHIEFNLFRLGRAEFDILYLCLHAHHLLADTPLHIKQQSVTQEDAITKKLYADYSQFKAALYQSIAALNPQYNPVALFKKTQKLLDRFLFILFAEDRLLLPPNFIVKIVEEHRQVQKLRLQQSLYERFKIYFADLLTGNAAEDIFAYNGGLFEPDEILDNLAIADDVLQQGVLRLSQYDYNTEVDVNILGHIFEHSLNEIESLQAQLENAAVDKGKTRRKKEGVFYTPRYITKYIVDNTVGTLCREQKAALQIVEEDYAPAVKKTKASEAGRKALVQKLDDYRAWLLQLTICDPACGSGAFLNAALEFLIAEHNYIDELTNKLMGASIGFTWTPNDILENNLFGVDINEEAVEIARLSLWLRTAQRGRKLSNLSSNIKAGNSLIDDRAVAGDKAFVWRDEFGEVFQKGGFDVVIGNPPYVFGGNDSISIIEKTFFKSRYETGGGKVNLFTLFIEKSHLILKNDGAFSFIIPNTFLRVTSYHESRKFFLSRFSLTELADLGNDVFNGAVTTAIILIAKKRLPLIDHTLKVIKDFSGNYTSVELSDLIRNNFVITTNISADKNTILKKIALNSDLLGNECKEMIFGVVITKNKEQVVSNVLKEGYKPFIEGKDITSYLVRQVDQYLNYKPELLHRARTKQVFEVTEKLMVQRITGGSRPLKVAYDNKQLYNKESINNIILNDNSKFNIKFILSLLNSKLINWFYNNQFTNESTLTVNISKEYLSKVPIKVPADQQPFIDKADIMLSKNKELQEVKQSLLQFLQAKHEGITASKKLADWPQLSFHDFLKELEKQKLKLSVAEQAGWLPYFEGEKGKAAALQAAIAQTDAEIDAMVYRLYGLTEEEMKIVESA